MGDSPPDLEDLQVRYCKGGLTLLITEELSELDVGDVFSRSVRNFGFARPRARLNEP